MDKKDLNRVLDKVHGDHPFDPIVSEEHKRWWFENALKAFQEFVLYYGRFCPDIVDEFYWHEWWEENKITYRVCAESTWQLHWGDLSIVPYAGTIHGIKTKEGVTRYLVEWSGFKTEFTITEACDKVKRSELIKRGVPPKLIDYAVSLLW